MKRLSILTEEKAGSSFQLILCEEKMASVFSLIKNHNFDSAKRFNELKIYIFLRQKRK